MLGVLLIIFVTGVVSTIPMPVLAALPAESLPAGSYWVLSTVAHRSATDNGSWTADYNWTEKITIGGHAANNLTMTYDYQGGSWSATATGAWVQPNGGESTRGTYNAETNDYTIDTATGKYTQVSNNNYKGYIGGNCIWLIDTEGLSVGSVLQDYNVTSSEHINVNGVDIDTWVLTYTCNSCNGWWRSGGDYAKGPETWTLHYDKNYGVLLRVDVEGNYQFASGGWNETRRQEGQTTYTNIDFNPSTPSHFLSQLFSQPYLLGGIAAVLIAAGVAVVKLRKGAPPPPPPPPRY
jgi:hypothetical protein